MLKNANAHNITIERGARNTQAQEGSSQYYLFLFTEANAVSVECWSRWQ